MIWSHHKKGSVTIFAACVLGTALNLPAADPAFESPAIGRFTLAASQGKELLKQCSRPTPRDVSEFWKPSSHDVDNLELALAKYLETREKAGQANPPKGQAYHRQYAGFTKQSERFIYGNFYPASSATGFWKDKESKQVFRVCDGGPAFWGIVFRVSTKTFEEIHFNGFG